MPNDQAHSTPPQLQGDFLCTADFEVGGGLVVMDATPWGDTRWGYITGGRFAGPRLSGTIQPGGGNWSRGGRLASGEAVGTFDARAVWRTGDDALISLSYTGRSVMSDAVRAAFSDPTVCVDPARYYLRIAIVFETASPAYDWLNGVLAIGIGERTDFGVRHHIYEVN